MPTEKMLYREIQAYRQNPLIYLVITLMLLLIGLFVYLLRLSEYADALCVGLLLFILVLIAFGKVTTTVTEKAVSLKFFPLVPKYSIPFDQIRPVYRQDLDPVADFGWYGFRVRGRNRAFLIQGTSIVAFVRHSGSTLLIGSQEPEKLYHVCQEILNRLNSST